MAHIRNNKYFRYFVTYVGTVATFSAETVQIQFHTLPALNLFCLHNKIVKLGNNQKIPNIISLCEAMLFISQISRISQREFEPKSLG